MTHISYSELKDWAFCAYYHKLTRIDKLKGFIGNEYTAFGTAMHSVCEKKLLKEDVDDDFFVKEFRKNIAAIADFDFPDNKTLQFIEQGKKIIPEIQKALDNYFDTYEVLEVEMPLYEPIEGEEEYKFKGFIDALFCYQNGN